MNNSNQAIIYRIRTLYWIFVWAPSGHMVSLYPPHRTDIEARRATTALKYAVVEPPKEFVSHLRRLRRGEL
jgi:hypothetical protein